MGRKWLTTSFFRFRWNVPLCWWLLRSSVIHLYSGGDSIRGCISAFCQSAWLSAVRIFFSPNNSSNNSRKSYILFCFCFFPLLRWVVLTKPRAKIRACFCQLLYTHRVSDDFSSSSFPFSEFACWAHWLIASKYTISLRSKEGFLFVTFF